MISAARRVPLPQTVSGQAFQTATPPGNLRPVQVVHRATIAADAVSLWLAEPGSKLAPAAYLPGQFITLAVPLGGEVRYRSYSLCGDGRADQPWRITIKRAGIVSDALCREVMPGDLLYSSPPRGAFTLPRGLTPDTPLIFIAAGSGITPIYGMLSALAGMPSAMRPPVSLHYASHTLEDILFRHELARLDPASRWLRQWHYISEQRSRITPDAVYRRAASAAMSAEWYICAPEALKRELMRMLHDAGVPRERLHLEVFAAPKARALALSVPLRREAAGHPGPVASVSRVHIAGTRATLDVRKEETLLECLERHRYRPAFGCRAGVCGACKLRVLDGQVMDEGDSVLSPHERSQGVVLACTALPHGPVTIALPGLSQAAEPGRGAGPSPAAPAGLSRSARAVVRLGLVAAVLAVFIVSWLMTTPGGGGVCVPVHVPFVSAGTSRTASSARAGAGTLSICGVPVAPVAPTK